MAVKYMLREGLTKKKIGNKFLLLDAKRHEWMCLNKMGNRILKMFKYGNTEEDVIRGIEDKYKIPKETYTEIASFIKTFFNEIVRKEFLIRANASDNKILKRKKRRHVIPLQMIEIDISKVNTVGKLYSKLVGQLEIVARRRPLYFMVKGRSQLPHAALVDLFSTLKMSSSLRYIFWFIEKPVIDEKVIKMLDAISLHFSEPLSQMKTFFKYLKEKSTVPYGFDFTPSVKNIKKINRIIDYADKMDVHFAYVNRCFLTAEKGGTEAYYDSLGKKYVLLLKKYYRYLKECAVKFRTHPPVKLSLYAFHPFLSSIGGFHIKNCGLGVNRISIDLTGNIYPCRALHHKEFLLGNINNCELSEILSLARKRFQKNWRYAHAHCFKNGYAVLSDKGCRASAYYVTGSIKEKDPLFDSLLKAIEFNIKNHCVKSLTEILKI